MINFTKLDLTHKKLISEYLGDYNFFTYDYSFLTLYQWRVMCNTEFSIINDVLIIKKHTEDTGTFFMKPLGYIDKNIEEIVSELICYKNSKSSFKHLFGDVEASFAMDMKKTFGSAVSVEEDINNFDYMYSSNDLILLPGAKYHRKKNLYNQFVNKNEYIVRDINDPSVINDCIEYSKEWYRMKSDDSYILEYEIEGISDVLNNIDSFKLFGIAVYIKDKIIGFAFGEKVNDKMAIVHCEKADSSYIGAYAFLNKTLAEKYFYDVEFINRQDDLGLPGLRKAKKAYHPVRLEKKYYIDIEL
jgi:hypothetical protein